MSSAMTDEGAAGSSLPRIPRLDGLRGIAIALVVVFHTGLGVLPGGYLGIDLFFVLSGYLITTLLLAEFQRSARIDLRRFWARRFRRLVPALLVVLVAVLAFALAVDDRTLLDALRGDGLATLFYAANWRFIATGQSYFASFAPSPLRHTWSLAVEEQWYLFWPPLLWLLLKGLQGRRRPLLAVIGLLGVSSAVWMGGLSGGDLSRAYYGTDSRAQTLLVGAGLAVLLWGRPAVSARVTYRVRALGCASAVGLALIVVLSREQAGWMYRGGFLVVAVLGAAMVASAVLVETGPLSWVLQLRVLRYLGVISYGLYLWHWPIDVLLNADRMGFDGWPLAIVQIALAVGLAAVSSALLELPIRRGWPHVGKPWKVVSASGAMAGVAVLLAVFAVGQLAVPLPKAGAGIEVAKTPPWAGDLNVLVVGDSVAWALTRYVPPDLHLHADVVWHSQCDLIGDTVYLGDTTNDAEESCSQWPDQWRLAAASRPDAIVVVLGLRQLFDPLVDGDRLEVGSGPWRVVYRKRVQFAIDTLRSESDAPILFFDVPCYTWAAAGTDTAARDPQRRREVNQELRSVVAANHDVSVVDYSSVVCDGGEGQDNIERYRPDGAHPTAEGGTRIWNWLDPQIRTVVGDVAGHRSSGSPGATGSPASTAPPGG